MEKVKGHLAMLLFAALISGSFSIGHLAAPHIDPVALTALRFVFASIIMALIGFAISRKLPVITNGLWRFVILGALMATYFVLMFVALRITSPVSTSAVFTLIPAVSALFGWILLRQKTSLLGIVSLAIAGAGAIWVIFRGDLDAILSFRIGKGEAIFFIGCVAHGIYAPLVRKYNHGEAVLNFTFMTLVASAVCVFVWGFNEVVSLEFASLPAIVWITIAYLSIFTTAFTFFLLQYSSMRLPASKVMAYGYLVPGIVALYEGMLGHGWVSISVMIGVVVTATALMVLAFSSDG